MDSLSQGLFVTAAGMGIVFAGLGVLWGAIAILARLPQGRGTTRPRGEKTPAPRLRVVGGK